MGLTIHYQLATTGEESHARKLVQQLRQGALDLPFEHVGDIVEFRGNQCDWRQQADDDPKYHRFGDLYRWLNQDVLRPCFFDLRKDAAGGVDRVSFQGYEKSLEANLTGVEGQVCVNGVTKVFGAADDQSGFGLAKI